MASITLWFTLGTGGMALGTLLLAAGLQYVPRADWRRYAILIAVPGIAVVAYALMALGIGGIESSTGEVAFIPRYVDWLLTTPLHIIYLGLFAGAARSVIARASVLQAATIVFGMVGALVASPLKWLLYLAGLAAFAGVVYYTYVDFDKAANEQGGTTAALYSKLRAFLVVLWLIYPLIWVTGPNAIGLMDIETTALVVAYIDIVSKVGLGLIALNGHLAHTDAPSVEGVPADD
ncbi:bacteriorhodopsin [Salinibaculum rarum]|uniref:bacteriorhodopsin n=1 Tax=Salinibaculum rarum TaxID=3058903 RepID=UPI00265EF094|nr:bacteriorhodopsin [Salinibaculum sp. KK48]